MTDDIKNAQHDITKEIYDQICKEIKDLTDDFNEHFASATEPAIATIMTDSYIKGMAHVRDMVVHIAHEHGLIGMEEKK